jgi:hypothetical protein
LCDFCGDFFGGNISGVVFTPMQHAEKRARKKNDQTKVSVFVPPIKKISGPPFAGD